MPQLTNTNSGNYLTLAPGHEVESAQLLLLVDRFLEDLRVLAVVLAALSRVLLRREDDDSIR